jgi:molybdate transport system ATP-binding protein
MNYFKIKKRLYGSYGDLDLDVEFSIDKGDFLAITGESGSGKTTILRIIAGLEKSESTIVIDGEIWQDKKIFLSPQNRKVGFVFQDYALFPNMSVLENLLYANRDLEFAEYLLEITNLTSLKNRYPSTLSGGQKQRVTLARALMRKPKILLMDEPFSALDYKIKEKLYEEILFLHERLNLTTIMVSHSLSEVFKLANKIMEIKNGKIIDFINKKSLMNNLNSLIVKGEIIEIQNDGIIISFGNQLAKIKTNKNLKIGDKIEIEVNSFKIKK